jgi:Mg-chelatase subunit ChlI
MAKPQSNQAPTVFDEKAALETLANVKTPQEAKQEAFHACIDFVTAARKKNVAWKDIAARIHEKGGPKITGSEVSRLYQQDGRVDPAPRAARKAAKAKPINPSMPKPQTEAA